MDDCGGDAFARGIPECAFAGVLAGRPVRMARFPGAKPWHPPVWADADFAICGLIRPGVNRPEGPFGDHLGYYSLKHDFPVLQVDRTFHRKDAIWPFTVVGRPPQEDSAFGAFIHELTSGVVPKRLPGVKGFMRSMKPESIPSFLLWEANGILPIKSPARTRARRNY